MDLLSFLNSSHTRFHATAVLSQELDKAGYTRLSENESWDLKVGGKYYVTRNGSALLAFRLPTFDFKGFMMSASHDDSPTLQVKEHAELETADGYIKLNVEKYGGLLCAPWLDRPLTVAGRVMVQVGSTIETRLVYVDKDLLLIPNVAIHMNRSVNEGLSFDAKTDMLPLIGLKESKNAFRKLIAEAAGCRPEDILGQDLFLCIRQKAIVWGASDEFISSAKLDDLLCAYCCFQGFMNAGDTKSVPIFGMLDNEEIGSLTKQGADSTFLSDIVDRICEASGKNRNIALANSFMVSADNAHAVHPNHPEYCDVNHRPIMNGGMVIKHGVRYATDGPAQAVFVALCNKAGIPVQQFSNRSDMAGGSTLGNISNGHTSVNTVDVGLAQLAMHSPFETAGIHDTDNMRKAMTAYYNTSLTEKNGLFVLE